MRIVFVRHGEPDYEKDCLTERGHLQAKAAGVRLIDEAIQKIYRSPMGRAKQTALHIADELKIPENELITLDFMREIECDTPNPWEKSNVLVRNNESLLVKNWTEHELFKDDYVVPQISEKGKAFDEFLRSLGYKRRGLYYEVTRKNTDTIAVVSHAGSSTSVFARLFNLPATFVFDAIQPSFTTITTVTLNGEVGEIVSPRFEIANDSRHIRDVEP